jgi:hypothetical protein
VVIFAGYENGVADENNAADVFVYERSTGTATLVSHVPGAPNTVANGGSNAGSVSADGTVLAFASVATDLAAGDLNGSADVFVSAFTRSSPPIDPPPDGPDLVLTVVNSPPATAAPGDQFSVATTVMNRGTAPAGGSTTRYHLSVSALNPGLGSWAVTTRQVTALAPGASAQQTTVLRVPLLMPAGSYFVVACADGVARVAESIETNNCSAAPTKVAVGRPDLSIGYVIGVPATAARGSRFAVRDSAQNYSVFTAGKSTTRYYLSLDDKKGAGDRLLTATRAVPALAPNATVTAPAAVTVTIPFNMTPGSYFLFACADDLTRVDESNEANNCTRSQTRVRVP